MYIPISISIPIHIQILSLPILLLLYIYNYYYSFLHFVIERNQVLVGKLDPAHRKNIAIRYTFVPILLLSPITTKNR